MKIGFTSDLHIDHNQDYPIEQLLLAVGRQRGLDKLFIAGDISNEARTSLAFMQLLTDQGLETHGIFGNHDYYEHGGQFMALRQQQNVFPYVINDVGIIADTGWYDYSWYEIGTYRKYQLGKYATGCRWPDHRFIKWPEEVHGDPACWFTRHCLDEMQRQKEVLDQQGISRKIVMLHMVPQRVLLEPGYEYMATNPFFGSARTSLWLQNLKPEICVFGHTHFAKDRVIDDTLCISRPLGYFCEWPQGRTLVQHIDNMIYEIEI
jgi:putative phosphoesterase